MPPTSRPSATAVPPLPLEVLSVDVIPALSLPLGSAVDPDGTMYAVDMLNNRVIVRHPDGEIVYWGERGGGPGEFDFAPVTENDASTSIAVSPDGELIVVGDGNNHRVQVFDGSRTSDLDRPPRTRRPPVREPVLRDRRRRAPDLGRRHRPGGGPGL